jgi:hypothetical protein
MDRGINVGENWGETQYLRKQSLTTNEIFTSRKGEGFFGLFLERRRTNELAINSSKVESMSWHLPKF